MGITNNTSRKKMGYVPSRRMKHLKNIHPGEVLQEEFLVPMGISVYRLAKETGLSQTRLGQIIRGERNVTAETAIKIGRF